jgi:hypothetical protein
MSALAMSFAIPEVHAKAKGPNSLQFIPTITEIAFNSAGDLVASGIVLVEANGKTKTIDFDDVPVSLALAADQTGAGTCPILDLTLGAIELNVLGLIVETSDICLKLTALDDGGLLGDLLCEIGDLLSPGIPLNIDLGLTPIQVSGLLPELENLLNAALGSYADAVITHITEVRGRSCAILNLELGPVDLTLLGLNVHLDDCENGPITLDITARRGQLLGNLLCGLLHGGGGGLGVGSTLEDILDAILARLNR